MQHTLVSNYKWEDLWFSFNSLLVTFTRRSDLNRTNTFPVNRSSQLSKVVMNIFVASLIGGLFAHHVSLVGQPCLGIFGVVPYLINLKMIDVQSEMFKALGNPDSSICVLSSWLLMLILSGLLVLVISWSFCFNTCIKS